MLRKYCLLGILRTVVEHIYPIALAAATSDGYSVWIVKQIVEKCGSETNGNITQRISKTMLYDAEDVDEFCKA